MPLQVRRTRMPAAYGCKNARAKKSSAPGARAVPSDSQKAASNRNANPDPARSTRAPPPATCAGHSVQPPTEKLQNFSPVRAPGVARTDSGPPRLRLPLSSLELPGEFLLKPGNRRVEPQDLRRYRIPGSQFLRPLNPSLPFAMGHCVLRHGAIIGPLLRHAMPEPIGLRLKIDCG